MQPLPLTSAFLIAQFLLVAIVYVGIVALKSGEKSYFQFSGAQSLATTTLPRLVLGFALITLLCLVCSRDFVLPFKSGFSDFTLPALRRTDAFLLVFLLDVVGAGILIGITGGAKYSPFSAMLLVVPLLSIILRETPTRFFSYTGLAVLLFLLFRNPHESGRAIVENPHHMVVFQLVTVGCLVVMSMVGYATRPEIYF